MKIGVILRENEDCFTLNCEIKEVIESYGGVVIGISSYDEELLGMLDGFILQGGTDITPLDLKVVSYLYHNDIPTLGICLGMQTMGVFQGGSLKYIENHYDKNKKYVHMIKVDTNSKIYAIMKQDRLEVNSRHREALETTKLSITSYSSDGVIESVEDDTKTFFIGVQWHPESMMDDSSILLFDAFFKSLSE